MNHKQAITKASSLASTDKESLFDSMLITDFWNKVSDIRDIELIQKVHKMVGYKVTECINHWRGYDIGQRHSKEAPKPNGLDGTEESRLFRAFLDNKTLFTLDDPTKQVGNIVRFGKRVGVVRKIEGKIFIVHTTDGQDLPFIAEEE